MMTYEFRDVNTGEGVEVMYRPSEAPSLDEVVEIQGRTLRRVVSLPHVNAERSKPIIAISQEPWHPHASKYDKNGTPVFSNKLEAREFAKKTQDDPRGSHRVVFDA